ncbi:MAG: hypothetical protein IPM25_02050 [Chloracidobacterium sp.]|nr:hypothetical protein [Chloracidobacterium sp.]
MAREKKPDQRFIFSSSVAADTWHPKKDPKAYEWWYFDALSDSGNEAIVIVFLDNYIYSPRYNRVSDGLLRLTQPEIFPAVSFTYFAEGRQMYRAETEFSPFDFSASEDEPRCVIGKNGFRFSTASYGSGYMVSIDLPLPRGQNLRANLEWLSIEADLTDSPVPYAESSHCWNMAAPRSDVCGRITITDSDGRIADKRSFRGTGYHDHNLDDRWLAKTVQEWHWGRAHFTDLTTVFCRYSELGDEDARTRLMLVRDGELTEHEATVESSEYVRDKFGISYPTREVIRSVDGLVLETEPMQVIDSSFYHLRFLTSFKSVFNDGRARSAVGITEFIAPRALKYRWLNWLSDLRTGKDGKSPFIP